MLSAFVDILSLSLYTSKSFFVLEKSNKGILMNKLNYSPKLRAMLESFLKDRKSRCLMNVLYAVWHVFIFAMLFKDMASLFIELVLYVLMIVECVAFYYLYSVDNILRPRFQAGIMLIKNSEQELFLKWAVKKGLDEYREANFLISELFKSNSNQLEE